jgi:glutamate dehydrogenase
MGLFGDARDALAHGSYWFLRHLPQPVDIGAAVDRFGPGTKALVDSLDQLLDAETGTQYRQRVAAFGEQGIDEPVGRRLAALPYLFPSCEVVAAAEAVDVDVIAAGRTFFALDGQLRLSKLQGLIERTRHRNHWERYALDALFDDLFSEHRRLAIQALGEPAIREIAVGGEGTLDEALGTWLHEEVEGHSRWQRLLDELDRASAVDLPMLAVAMRSLSSLNATSRAAA